MTLFGLYCLGLVVAPLVAFLLKRTLLRGETPAFVMEMPLYKMPSLRLIVRRSFDSGWMFVKRAGTLILATMIVVWACSIFPAAGVRRKIEARRDGSRTTWKKPGKAGKARTTRQRKRIRNSPTLRKMKVLKEEDKKSTNCAASGRAKASGPGGQIHRAGV